MPVGGGGGGGNNNFARDNYPAYEEEDIDVMNRPIVPKKLDYAAAAAAATAGEDADADPLASTGMPLETFPPGQHPLEGVPNFANLATPEPLTIKSRYVICAFLLNMTIPYAIFAILFCFK